MGTDEEADRGSFWGVGSRIPVPGRAFWMTITYSK